MRKFRIAWIIVIVAGLVCGGRERVGPDARAAGPDVKHYDEQVRPFLAQHCLGCHGGEKPKGDFRLDQLLPNFAGEANRERWLAVRERLTSGEMPPKPKPRPPAKEVQALADWIGGKVAAAEAAERAAQGRVVLRRLNRVEYAKTLGDLLEIDADLKELLPLDTSANGFDNIGEALQLSSFAMERYLEAADTALNQAIANGPRPATIKKRYSLKDEKEIKRSSESKRGELYRHLDDSVVLFSSSNFAGVNLAQFHPPDRGNYRFRISASGFQSSGKPITLRVNGKGSQRGEGNQVIGFFEFPADKPTIAEFVVHLEARNTIHLHPSGLVNSDQAVRKDGVDKYKGPGLAVQWVEVEGPLYDSWPPPSHRRLFGNLPQAPAPVPGNSNRVEVVSKQPLADADRILRAFARRAFRRTVTDTDVKPFLDIVKDKLAEKYSFEEAVRVGLKGVLVSPKFLFLDEKPGKLDDFALASRLSYFLWSTMPDEELLTLAEQGKLNQPATLRGQVERLLKHPKAAAFTENFVGQWLNLRDIDDTAPSRRLYPEFDDLLKASMVQETQLFFDEVLKNDLSLTNFVASDFTMLNERLAKHYGIPGVEGPAFRKVPLPPGSHRGGVLTMASVLKVTANGTYTHPVHRGVWVLDRILGTPPAPPPAGVPAVEPDIRGATTIRAQLAKHREIASCAACHCRIDPPGFALESFDVIGGWRENYRVQGRPRGPQVDPADVLPDGAKFRDIDEFKQLLLRDKDQLARALTDKLLTYATGGPLKGADKPEIEAIIGGVREKKYGLRSLVHEVVQSKLFQCK